MNTNTIETMDMKVNVNVIKCTVCGQRTTGSIGAAGLYWPMICQVCKDAADIDLLNQVKLKAAAMGFIRKTERPERELCTTHNEVFQELWPEQYACESCFLESSGATPCVICSTLDQCQGGKCFSCSEVTKEEFQGVAQEDK